MERGRRKRPASSGEDESRRRVGKQSATDEEVEEFFAILRRIHEVKRLENGPVKSDGGQPEKAGRWRPAFEREDFEMDSAVKSDGETVLSRSEEENAEKRKEEEEVMVFLDLNAVPQPESNPQLG